jgi:hypothetical protein
MGTRVKDLHSNHELCHTPCTLPPTLKGTLFGIKTDTAKFPYKSLQIRPEDCIINVSTGNASSVPGNQCGNEDGIRMTLYYYDGTNPLFNNSDGGNSGTVRVFTMDSAVLWLGSSSCDCCPVRIFRQQFTPEVAIGSHACSLEANVRVTNGISLGCSLLLPVATVNSVQTLKDIGRITTVRLTRLGLKARCAFSDRNLHTRMPLYPKHSSRESTPLTVVIINHVETLKASKEGLTGRCPKAWPTKLTVLLISRTTYVARFQTGFGTRGCCWIPRLLPWFLPRLLPWFLLNPACMLHACMRSIACRSKVHLTSAT